MQDFRDKIMNIAERKRQIGNRRSIPPEDNNSSTDLKEVMNILYGKTELGVNIYNEAIIIRELSIFRLPEELLQVFLNGSGNQIGFCLMSDLKFVLFIGKFPNEVLVLGKKRQSSESGETFLTRAIRLIRIKFEHSGNTYSYQDNTGTLIDPDEIIIHIINWAVI
ncbi:MAG: hypothetical protein WBD99_11010 [Thermodesulfobacteriota bacterium]